MGKKWEIFSALREWPSSPKIAVFSSFSAYLHRGKSRRSNQCFPHHICPLAPANAAHFVCPPCEGGPGGWWRQHRARPLGASPSHPQPARSRATTSPHPHLVSLVPMLCVGMPSPTLCVVPNRPSPCAPALNGHSNAHSSLVPTLPLTFLGPRVNLSFLLTVLKLYKCAFSVTSVTSVVNILFLVLYSPFRKLSILSGAPGRKGRADSPNIAHDFAPHIEYAVFCKK